MRYALWTLRYGLYKMDQHTKYQNGHEILQFTLQQC